MNTPNLLVLPNQYGCLTLCLTTVIGDALPIYHPADLSYAIVIMGSMTLTNMLNCFASDYFILIENEGRETEIGRRKSRIPTF